jgi:protein transport protein HofQ
VKITTAALLAALMVVVLAPAAPAQTGVQSLVTIHASETPLSDVLAILSEKSGLNIVASSTVEGRLISINLRETPVEEALNLIVRAAGLGYERIGTSILVAEEQVLTQETGVGTYVIPIQYADAYELVEVVKTMVDKVAADPGGNRLVVVATPGAIDQIRSVIKELDVPPAQILLETEVVEVTTDDLYELGIDWQKITKQTLIFSEEDFDGEDQNTGEIPTSMPFRDPDVDWDNIYRQAMGLNVALDFLETEGKARVLTQSKLATLNNRTAEIHIGDVIPYTVTGLTTGGVYEVRVEKERVGVEVSVTPRAAGDGHISIVGFRGPNEEIPWTKERRAITQVRVMDGQTFMIAGLLSEDESNQVTKVPLLGDIPILGYLFQHNYRQTKHSDLIIKITPTIVK